MSIEDAYIELLKSNKLRQQTIIKLSKENKKLKEELNRYKEMEAKGLEEFKNVGGCWGCGLQLQLEQNIKDLKKYGQENVELLQENVKLKEAFRKAKEVIAYCYDEEKPFTSCIDCKYYDECKIQPVDYALRIIEEVL